ncbi:MAG: hypothetical protein KIT31_11685 [Deltaproteobacteria bacterium]|nr:hypothetical protein [Deltaproteobacteria bacterium]
MSSGARRIEDSAALATSIGSGRPARTASRERRAGRRWPIAYAKNSAARTSTMPSHSTQ